MQRNNMSLINHKRRSLHAPRPSPLAAQSAFSLVELLVVIGIISLLIGIALPAFSRAKEATRKATTTATINSIAGGIDTFRADEKLGGSYPPSYFCSEINPASGIEAFNPYGIGDPVFKIGGAGLVVWALAGADMLGTPGFRDLNHIDPDRLTNWAGVAAWADDTHAGTSMGPADPGGLYAMNGSTPIHPRSSFVDPTKMKFTQRKSDATIGDYFEVPAGRGRLTAPCFLDSFDQPILYYKANPGRPNMVCVGLPPVPYNTRFTPVNFFNPVNYGFTGIYNLIDNQNIAELGVGLDFGAGNKHFYSTSTTNPIGNYTGPRNPGEENNPTFRGSFGWTVLNPSSTVWAPHNPETYILLSAGPDGLFGTPDDIANYEVNQ